MAYTSVKEGIFSESFSLCLGYFDQRKAETDLLIRVPSGGGPGVAWVAKDEHGEGTARIMMTENDPDGVSWKNRRVLLSGTKALMLQELADMITDILGWGNRPLKAEAVSKKKFVAHHTEQETGPKSRKYVKLWSTTYPAMEAGELAVVDPLLQKLLGGRRLKPMKDSIVEIVKKTEVFSG